MSASRWWPWPNPCGYLNQYSARVPEDHSSNYDDQADQGSPSTTRQGLGPPSVVGARPAAPTPFPAPPSVRTVALISPKFAPDIGGLESHVRELAAGLTATGHAVTVFTLASSKVIAMSGRTGTFDGFTVRRFTLPLAAWKDIPPPEFLSHLGRELGGFDIVHAHSYHALPALGVALLRKQAPFLLTPHYHGTGHSAKRQKLHAAYRPLGHFLMRRTDAVIAVSEAERSLLAADFGPALAAKVTVIPNGVNPARLVAPYAVDGPIVLSVGRLEPYKRVDLLIRALEVLPASTQLVVAGDGPARRGLEQLAVRLGVSARVRMLGFVSDSDLSRWRATASVFATASAHEAFGLTLADALSAGLPFIASDIPAHREIAELARSATIVHGVVPTTPGMGGTEQDALLVHGFADALRNVLFSGERHVATSLGHAERRQAAALSNGLWSWQEVVEATQRLYNSLLSRPLGSEERHDRNVQLPWFNRHAG